MRLWSRIMNLLFNRRRDREGMGVQLDERVHAATERADEASTKADASAERMEATANRLTRDLDMIPARRRT